MSEKAPHIATGKMGENAAADYLAQKGYTIAARNFRAGKGEIDLIAWQSDRLLVFIEVKTRQHELFGGAEAAVTVGKQKLLAQAAGVYMEEIGYDWAIRFDVIAVLVKDNAITEIRHHEDAFIWI